MLARESRAELARRTILARLEALVSPAAFAAFRDQQFHAGLRQITEHLARLAIANDSARRNGDQCVLAAASRAVAAAARLTVFGAECTDDAEVGQGVDAIQRAQRNAAAVASIATVRPAEGHELLAPEAHAATAAVARLDANVCLVHELHAFEPSSCIPRTLSGAAPHHFQGLRPTLKRETRLRAGFLVHSVELKIQPGISSPSRHRRSRRCDPRSLSSKTSRGLP